MLHGEWTRLRNRMIWSWAGITGTWRAEQSFRFWVSINILSLAGVILLDLTGAERALILALGVLVLAAELGNTAIENAVDLAEPERNPVAKLAKDAGSAAVALTALAAGLAWLSALLS